MQKLWSNTMGKYLPFLRRRRRPNLYLVHYRIYVFMLFSRLNYLEYAQIIDLCNDARTELKNREDSYPGETSEMARLYSVAITEAQTAQMWAVKAITWK